MLTDSRGENIPPLGEIMTRQEIQNVIDANPDRELYLSYGDASISLHEKVSKTKVFKCAKHIHAFRIGSYGQERPDLAMYLDRPNGAEKLGWDNLIVTFDATR